MLTTLNTNANVRDDEDNSVIERAGEIGGKIGGRLGRISGSRIGRSVGMAAGAERQSVQE